MRARDRKGNRPNGRGAVRSLRGGRAEPIPPGAADVGGNDVSEQRERPLVYAHDEPAVGVLRQVDGHPAPGRADVAGPAVGIPHAQRPLVAPELAPLRHEAEPADGVAYLEETTGRHRETDPLGWSLPSAQALEIEDADEGFLAKPAAFALVFIGAEQEGEPVPANTRAPHRRHGSDILAQPARNSV